MTKQPALTPAARARIEIAKFEASKRLQRELASTRLAHLAGVDEELYFQNPLCFAYADYVREIFCAHLAEFRQLPWGRSKLLDVLNEASQELVAAAVQMWRGSGGKPEFKDHFVETAFKTLKASQCYQDLLHKIAPHTEDQPGVQGGGTAEGAGDSGELSADQSARSLPETEPSLSALVPGRSPYVADARAASRKAAKPHPRYQQIYAALRRIAEARPSGQAEVFALLDRDRVPVPPARPFEEGSRWMQGFRKDPKRARVWLSKAWSRLGLRPFVRGPKVPRTGG